MATFNKGDVIYQIGQTQPLTVEYVLETNSLPKKYKLGFITMEHKKGFVICSWFKDGDLKRSIFDPEILTKELPKD